MTQPRCPACDAVNRADVHFCTTCGRRLTSPIGADTLTLLLRRAHGPR